MINLNDATGNVTVTIISEGSKVSDEYGIIAVEVIKAVNKIPYAQIVFIDGNAAKQKFLISDSDIFKPGNNIEIKVRYEGKKDNSIFKGIVTKQNIKSGCNNSTLTVELKDTCIKLDSERKSVIYEDKTDSEVIKYIISNSSLKVDKVDDTKVKHKELVQYYSTDWDFILSRSDMNACLVFVNDGAISVVKPSMSEQEKCVINYGVTPVYNFNMTTDITNQYDKVTGSCLDIKTQKAIEPKKAVDFSLKQGNVSASDSAKKIGKDKLELVTGNYSLEGEVQAWIDSKMMKNRLSLLTGTITINGIAEIKTGDNIKFQGLGNRFNGKTIVTGVRHLVSTDGWRTEFQFGISSEWLYAVNDNFMDKPASGFIPAVNGLQIGVVQDFKEDPEKNFRVRVNIPAIGEKNGSMWARLISCDSGKERGIFFRPEKDDEVLIGFLNDDPRNPVIIGSLHNEKNIPPFGLEAENINKGIITRTKMGITFNDKEKTIKVNTPSGNTILMNDEKGITITDKNKNEILFDENGIQFKDKNGNTAVFNDKGIELKDKKGNDVALSSDGISVKSASNLNLEAKGDVNIKGSGSIKIKGSMIDLN
jgi:Rhs element Vgr protein